DTLARINKKTTTLQEKSVDFMNELRELELATREHIRALDDKVVLVATGFHFDYLKSTYASCPNVIDYLHDVQSDILNHKEIFVSNEEDSRDNGVPTQVQQLQQMQEIQLESRYIVHLLIDHEQTDGVPIITASNPTFQ